MFDFIYEMSEKDLIATLFFGSLFLILLIWVLLDNLKNLNRDLRLRYAVEIEFVKRLSLVPILALFLRANHVGKLERRRRIGQFLYS